MLQRRQGQLIAAPEEIAFHNGWIDADQLTAQASRFKKTQYGMRLLDNLRREAAASAETRWRTCGPGSAPL